MRNIAIHRRAISILMLACLLVGFTSRAGADEKKYRVDADGPVKAPGEKPAKGQPDWFRPADGQFPPEELAHSVTGELILVDHIERHFQIRVDRNDTQDRGYWDLPLDAFMLPYGSIYYHGAPAALPDIPLGTHLHGLFYIKGGAEEVTQPIGPYGRQTPEADFRRCFRIEDDFTFYSRQKEAWLIDDIDLTAMKLTATLQQDGKPVGKPKLFDLLTSTHIFKGNAFVDVKALEKGQLVQLNLTWATLYGPGRITELWIDDASRKLATNQQLETHRNYIRQRGFPGWVTAVDDETQIVTLTLFGGVDPRLFDELSLTDGTKVGWPMFHEADDPNAPKGTIACARDTLMTFDPVNDRKGGNILSIKKIPVEPGSSGIQIRVKCDLLLEGFRPKHIIRFFPATWKVLSLPREELYTGRE